MLPREAVLAAITHREVRPVPCVLSYEDEVGRRLDAHYGSDNWRRSVPEYIVGVANLDTDRKLPAADPAYRIDPYGSLWRVDRRPWHLEKPGLPDPTLQGYRFPCPEEFFIEDAGGKLHAHVAESRKTSFMVGYTVGGLFERAWAIRGFENFLADLVEEEDFAAELLDRLTAMFLAYVGHLARLPLDGILFGDDWGDQRGIIMGPALWRKWFKPRWAAIFAAAKARGLAVLCHSCGSVVDILPDLIEIGLDVLESVQPEARGMEPAGLKARFGGRMAFWGGVGTQRLLALGTPAEIRAEVARLSWDMGVGGGYVLAAAKPLLPEVPTENAAAFVEALAERT